METPATTPISGTLRRGLVLQGGGAKGAFQFGVLQRLKEARIQFDVIAGTSVGALNGAIVAAGAWELGDQMWSNLMLGRAFRWRVLAAIYTFISLPCELYLGWVTAAYDSLLPMWLRRLFHLLTSLPFVAVLFSINLTVVDKSSWLRVLCGAFTLLGAWAVYIAIGKQNSMRLQVVLPYAFGWITCVAVVAFSHDRSIFGVTLNPSLVALILSLSLSPLLLVGGYIHQWTNATLFSNSPLHKTVEAVVRTGIQQPLFATTAEMVPEYVDPDDYEYSKFRRSTVYFPAQRSGFRPAYERVDKLDHSGAVDALVRSAALPLGVVPNSRVGAKRVRFVDGGVTDNTPWFPLIDSLPCEQIVIVLCEPESDAKDEAKLTRAMWSKRDRAVRVTTNEHKIPEYHGRNPWDVPPQMTVRNDPPVVVPLRDPQFWPESRTINLVVISPDKPLGGLLRGTMNFSRTRAMENIRLGREAAGAELKKGRLS